MVASREIDTPGVPPRRNQKTKTSGIRISRFLKLKMPDGEDGENAEAGKGRRERESEEARRSEQQTPGGNPDDGQEAPERRRHRHVLGGAWLKQGFFVKQNEGFIVMPVPLHYKYR
ncbi:hypothetical protein NDU88_009173 [Pleurodeles waltl]|uniref:Uncharacterized protein n=1 Tax=Pleurodeles waltl TaxID=8319 RepID=A0AAV7P1N5_PLEWA|nr:hypothetical protein NDU88_009173 [Pleurodeles waltl]